MKYFVLTGYLPTPHPPTLNPDGSYSSLYFVFNIGKSTTQQKSITREEVIKRYSKEGIPLPKLGETVFLRTKLGRISLFVFGNFDALILIVSRSQRNALLLGRTFRAACTCFLGKESSNNHWLNLLEFAHPPSANMSRRDLAESINSANNPREEDPDFLLAVLGSGTILDHFQITKACEISSAALRSDALLNALWHLDYSHDLVWGLMTSSFYESHYKKERRAMTRYQLEHIYLENRFRYDAAFVAAFKGIESLLNKTYFRRKEIRNLLKVLDLTYGTKFSSSYYRSFHETFSSQRKWWKYDDLIAYYLKLRNSVSAHSNPLSPHMVMEDQVFEIQHLLRSMLGAILMPE